MTTDVPIAGYNGGSVTSSESQRSIESEICTPHQCAAPCTCRKRNHCFVSSNWAPVILECGNFEEAIVALLQVCIVQQQTRSFVFAAVDTISCTDFPSDRKCPHATIHVSRVVSQALQCIHLPKHTCKCVHSHGSWITSLGRFTWSDCDDLAFWSRTASTNFADIWNRAYSCCIFLRMRRLMPSFFQIEM